MERIGEMVKHAAVFLFGFAAGAAFFAMGWFAAKSGLFGGQYQARLFMERNNARIDDGRIELTLEDAEFLRAHLFGKWRFKEPVSINHGLSRQCIEEMKNIEITFSEDSVQTNGFNQNTFSDPRDMFIYLDEGVNQALHLPVYHVVTEENKESCSDYEIIVPSYDVARDYWEKNNENSPKVPGTPDVSEMTHIYCDLGIPARRDQVSEPFLEKHMWVDPADTDKLYLFFREYWVMERVE